MSNPKVKITSPDFVGHGVLLGRTRDMQKVDVCIIDGGGSISTSVHSFDVSCIEVIDDSTVCAIIIHSEGQASLHQPSGDYFSPLDEDQILELLNEALAELQLSSGNIDFASVLLTDGRAYPLEIKTTIKVMK